MGPGAIFVRLLGGIPSKNGEGKGAEPLWQAGGGWQWWRRASVGK